MKGLVYLLLGATIVQPFVAADWQFKSRPDLTPPRLNISITAGPDVDDGYLFVQPYSSFEGPRGGPVQPAAYIFQNNGDLVWSSLGYFSAWIGNFQAKKWLGKPVLTAFEGSLDSLHGHGYGHVVLLDQKYQQVKVIRAANHKLASIHEATIIDEKTILMEIYQPLATDLTPYGGTEEMQWIAEGVFQEVDIETGDLIFEWNSLDFVDPSESDINITSGRAFTGVNSTDAWDYFHINSVDKDDEGNYLVSGRHTSAIYKVNGTSGEVIWRLGGKRSDFSVPKHLEFAYQHDARFRGRSEQGDLEIISFFDNSARSDVQRGGPIYKIDDHSKARIVTINHKDKTVTEIVTLKSPDGLLNPSQGNVQVLPNGNTFVGWGQAGAISEFRAEDGEAIFHAYLESGQAGIGTQSYRAFRYNWVGTPHETPSIIALCNGSGPASSCEGKIHAYVSWNGDTETKLWRFFMVSTADAGSSKSGVVQTQFLGESSRTSFETSFSVAASSLKVRSKEAYIFAQAYDAQNKLLSTTGMATIDALIQPYGMKAVPGGESLSTQKSAYQIQLEKFQIEL